MLLVNEDKCVGCGQCFLACPEGSAIKVWGVAQVVRENCTECAICIDYCPVDALEIR